MAGSPRSMTGQGHAECLGQPGTVQVEIRTVNNRGFKCVARLPDSLSGMESRIEALARQRIQRGSVQMTLHWRRPPGEGLPRLDMDAIASYHRQLTQACQAMGQNPTLDVGGLLALPGVVLPPADFADRKLLTQLVERTVGEAISKLNQMRDAEGAAMADTLRQEAVGIASRLDEVESLAPTVVQSYRDRLHAKLERLLAKHEVELKTSDLLREVQIFADRSDVSEEVTRLRSHLQQFLAVIGQVETTSSESERQQQPEATGRKLDFIVQEMFREANTTGSKSADAGISHHVVEIKCALERIRELVQNIE
ncbi:MAG: YicC/YloC family endoribonuclease [Planctomycetota bacterium]